MLSVRPGLLPVPCVLPRGPTQIDATTEVSTATRTGAGNVLRAHLLSGVLEVGMEGHMRRLTGARVGVVAGTDVGAHPRSCLFRRWATRGATGAGPSPLSPPVRRSPRGPHAARRAGTSRAFDDPHEAGQRLLLMFRQRQRLWSLLRDGQSKKSGGGGEAASDKVAEARSTPRSGRGAPASGGPTPAPAPAFSLDCLLRMLTAIVEDGLVMAPAAPAGPGAREGPGAACPHQALARDPGFQVLTLKSTTRMLRHASSCGTIRAIRAGAGPSGAGAWGGARVARVSRAPTLHHPASGIASDEGLERTARDMLQIPDWMALARPAYRTVEMVVGAGL